jgi:hypothetical protein
MAAILINGMRKDYVPPGGIAGVTDLHFDPSAQLWTPGLTVACPQGDSAGITVQGINLGVALDGGFAPRPGAGDDGFYATIKSNAGARIFATNLVGLGTTGTVMPTVSGQDNDIRWLNAADAGLNTFRGNWAAATVYNVGDIIRADSSFWRVVTTFGNKTSGGTVPTWALSAPNYGGTVADPGFTNGVMWSRSMRDAGTWTASTRYGVHAVTDGTDVHGKLAQDAVVTGGGVWLMWAGVVHTNAVTGSTEPAWSAANQSYREYWEDYAGSGTALWITGYQLFGPGSADAIQHERIVLTGLTAGIDGQTINVWSDGPSLTDVVLADQFDKWGVNNSLVGTDMESVAANRFDFAGTTARIPGGTSRQIVYSASAQRWGIIAQVQTPVISSQGDRRRRRLRKWRHE